MSLLFVDSKSVDEEMIQYGVYSIGVVRLTEHDDNASGEAEAIDGTKMGATGQISARKRRFRPCNALISSRVIKNKDDG